MSGSPEAWTPATRFTKQQPCPNCGGYDGGRDGDQCTGSFNADFTQYCCRKLNTWRNVPTDRRATGGGRAAPAAPQRHLAAVPYGAADALATPPPPTEGILLSTVEPERVAWLWPGRIPLGKLTVIDGDPGLGKSALALDLAARVSAGVPLPDGTPVERGGVVLLSAEDGLADTIAPRLAAAGADLARVVALPTVTGDDGQERGPTIPGDLAALERAILRVAARILVIDPLMAFLGGELNGHRDQDVRRALAPLARLAERTDAAIIVVRHLNKATGLPGLYRGGGSIGIVGAARSALLVARDPADPDRRIVAQLKSNLGPPVPAFAYRLEGTPEGAVRVVWQGATGHTADELLVAPNGEERSALDEAKAFLTEELAEGPRTAADLQGAARKSGIADPTLRRAKFALGVRSERVAGAADRGYWQWYLPPARES